MAPDRPLCPEQAQVVDPVLLVEKKYPVTVPPPLHNMVG